jgi:predicted nucleic acid-binding protein
VALYLDSSAIVKLVAVEPESAALRRFLRRGEGPWATSALARTEVVRALLPAGPAAVERARSVLSAVAEVVITRNVLDRAAQLEPETPLRTLDAIHLASAMRLGRDLTAVVTYDHRMADAAEELGLVVQAPR